MRRVSWIPMALVCGAATLVAGCTSGTRNAEPDTRDGLIAVWNSASRQTHDGDFSASYEVLGAACRAKWTKAAWTKNLSNKVKAEVNEHFDAVVVEPIATARIQTFTKARALVLADIPPYPPIRGKPYPPPFEYEQLMFFPSPGDIWAYEHGAWVTGWCPKFGPTRALP
jgi:hypothetical protein